MLYESPRLRLEARYRIATLALDLAGGARAALADLDAALAVVQARPGLDVLVLHPRGGCDGAEVADLGQRVTRRLSRLDAVTVAFLDGPCLGAALELALACDYRVAVGSAATRLGFAQVRAGAAPCWGGTVRLPRLVGLRAALDLLLTGRKLSAAQARDAGLVDCAAGPRLANVTLDRFVLARQASGRKPRRRRRWADRLPGRCAWLLRRTEAWP